VTHSSFHKSHSVIPPLVLLVRNSSFFFLFCDFPRPEISFTSKWLFNGSLHPTLLSFCSCSSVFGLISQGWRFFGWFTARCSEEASLLFSFRIHSFSAQTNSVDQAALIAFWNGLTNKGALGWNTTTSLCGQNGVTCSNSKVIKL